VENKQKKLEPAGAFEQKLAVFVISVISISYFKLTEVDINDSC